MNTIKVKNIAELKLRKGTPECTVEVLGYYTEGDGGGGEFFWDNTSTIIDNGGTIIQVTNVLTGRWKRIYNNKVHVKWFGAKGDGITNDTTFIQNAINLGLNIDLGNNEIYMCNNLTQTINNQKIYSTGAEIWKNANGDLITFNGNYVTLSGVVFRGQGLIYTGKNIVSNGSNITLNYCGSIDSQGLALHAKKDRTVIHGTNIVYYSSGAGTTGYDIELGNTTTTSLYSSLIDIYTSVQTGGIKLLNVGATVLLGGQIGKLKIDNTAGLAGSNIGMISNMRIIGNVDIYGSNGNFVNNEFGGTNILTIHNGSGININESNSYQDGYTTINNGNNSNVIIRQINYGGGIQLTYGDSNSLSNFKTDNTVGEFYYPQLAVSNNKGLRFKDNTNTEVGYIYTNSNILNIAMTPINSIVSYTIDGINSRYQFYLDGNPVVNFVKNGINIGTTTDPLISSGTGTPEGNKTAPIGSIYMRKDGGANTSLYIKESGVGNIGWVAK